MSESAQQFSAFRQAILAEIDPDATPIPKTPTVAFVWPTESCSIGCGHCSYSSIRRATPSPILSHIPELVEWLVAAGVSRFVACGGGEPLDEAEAVSAAI